MDFMNNWFPLALIIFCIIPLLLHIAKPFMKKKRLPPGPGGIPIIGNLLTIGDRPHESLTKLAKTYGPLMTVRLGCVTTVVASSTEMAREILQTNDEAFLGRPIPDAVTARTGNELSIGWLPAGPQWKKLRKLCTSQIFTAKRLDALQGLREQLMENMIERVVGAQETGEAIYIGKLVFGTTLNLLSNTMFSVDMVDPKSKEIEELRELIWRIMELAGKPNLADYFPFLKPFDPQGIRRKIKVSYDHLHSLVENIIDRRMKRRASESARTGDFLDVLLDHSEEHGLEELGRPDVRIMLMDLFIAGTDTTTTTAEWAMAELLHNPGKMAKAKQELAEKFGPRVPLKEQDVMQLPYLNAVIKEIMRLHPTTPLLLPHRAMKEVEICGFTVPKDTQIFVNTWSISRDDAYWENPNKFEPERFLGCSEYYDFRGRDFSFIPFSAGRRICPGVSLGVRMLNLLLATLLHNFDWKLPNGMSPEDMNMQDKFGITLQKVDPLVAIPVKA